MTTLSNSVQDASKKIMTLGINIAILGVLAIAYPNAASDTTTFVIGAFMLIAGLLRFTVAGSAASWKAFAVTVIYGALMAAAGLWVVTHHDMGLEVLTIIMAIYFLIDGAFQIYYSFKLRPVGGGSYLLINGILNGALGVLILAKFPESSFYAMGTYLGIKLLLDGLALTFTAGKIGKSVNQTDKNIAGIKEVFAKRYRALVAKQEKYREEENTAVLS